MPQKKKDRDSESGRNGRVDHLQTDHDLFLHAFEKPTQIYRYLRTRNFICPVFLHRNLTYLNGRCTRLNKERNNFKVDSLLAAKINKTRTESFTWLGDYMTLIFLGFFDKTISNVDVVEVDTFLTKISQKKRKDSVKVMQERLGTSIVKVNPDDTTFSNKVPAISISTENFKPIGGSLSRSYILQLNVTVLPSFSDTERISEDEPNSKRFKGCTNISYESELVVFDKHSRCLLSNGEYELLLQERFPTTTSYSPRKAPTWEIIPEASIDALDKSVSPFEDFQKCPTIKFRLVWTKEKSAELVDRPLPITIKKPDTVLVTTTNKDIHSDQNHNNGIMIGGAGGGGGADELVTIGGSNDASSLTIESINRNQLLMNGQTILTDRMQVVYQFIYNNNSLQQTEACDNFNCPWCTLNCMCLYSLLKHLKLCHDRFNFTYVPISSNGARIDVTINELYDGSYTGSPHDLVGPSSFAFSRTGPKRRPIVTSILVCRPKRLKPNLSEFLEIDENEVNNQRPYITGHNRLYYHTMTCLPVHPKELDIDSEDENDTAWLERKTMMMIDEFTDVNEGEKELMKMWNLHTIKNGYVGDIQIPLACDMFVDLKGKEILQKNLYKNFVMHICNLCDYGLVSPEVQHKTIRKLQRLWSSCESSQSILVTSNEKQLNYWNMVGYERQQQFEQHQLQTKKDAATAGTSGFTSDTKDTPKKDKDLRQQQQQQQQQQQHKSESKIDGKEEKTKASSVWLGKKILPKVPSNSDLRSERRKTLVQAKDQKANGSSSSSNSNSTASTSHHSSQSNQTTHENGTNKRKFSNLRDSPPKRRSSGTGSQLHAVKSITNRRNSLAAITTSAPRKRLSLILTKVDK